MKQKDILLIVVVVFISAIASMFISKAVFATPKDRKKQVEVVQAITTDFQTPDPNYFNGQSFDPTKLITIGNNSNPNPFTSQ